MGFWKKLGRTLGEEARVIVKDVIQIVRQSRLYPSLEAALSEYRDANGNNYVSRFAPPFEAVLEKPGVFGKKKRSRLPCSKTDLFI